MGKGFYEFFFHNYSLYNEFNFKDPNGDSYLYANTNTIYKK